MNKILLLMIACLNMTACTPKIQLETPKEGITINMNVVVDHKIDVKFDEKARAIIHTSDNKQEQLETKIEQFPASKQNRAVN
ncbi:YnbE family lipoprotein [[Haemophilus] ducreyi]|uniref:YnbE family lipoprotein n=1 Tax=Haemophilus ducreyi TaxID=730 RepID=UPI00065570B1|nr:YnbE family lipoprotein [[Haemophilus] ducreyi]AKO45091.1 hypothetical protein RZ66_02100 [[Haemophilus] ducreyi]AKO46493.1 hypothetical protein RZ67_02075 [[Haemophilus] ducreyi]AKO47835.1 hypothetical protein RZ68_02075 [[Haemophilus] ducreyi]AKO49222.1 hypothetical protein RZ69_02105 [[Haemophilus] ducreyi]ANF62272.1 hypothetical protein A6037_05905 [[Haemophilus] ducreyi]